MEFALNWPSFRHTQRGVKVLWPK